MPAFVGPLLKIFVHLVGKREFQMGFLSGLVFPVTSVIFCEFHDTFIMSKVVLQFTRVRTAAAAHEFHSFHLHIVKLS
jgi:hypothetical protein